MANEITIRSTVCPSCGGADTGTAFCEGCGRPWAAAAVTPRVAVVTVLRVATLVFLLAVAIVPPLFWLAVSGISFGSGGALVIRALELVLGILASAASVAAAIMSPVTPSRRVGGVIIAVVGGVLLVLTPFGTSLIGWGSATTSTYTVGVVFFLSWALTRPFGGRGFATIPIVALASAGLAFVPIAMLPYAIATFASIALSSAVIGGAVAIALAFERRRAQQFGVVVDPRRGVIDWPVQARPGTAATYALVLSLLGVSLAGIIVGHVAMGGLSRTGESGRGMAIAGLVLGYLGVVLTVISGVVWAVTAAAVLGTLSYDY